MHIGQMVIYRIKALWIFIESIKHWKVSFRFKLIEERTKLQTEFDAVRKDIVQIETQLGSLRSNLNALNGAIQQTNKMISMVEEKKEDEKL
mgnify:CR=1 FL=1